MSLLKTIEKAIIDNGFWCSKNFYLDTGDYKDHGCVTMELFEGCLYPGSFNPMHLGHHWICSEMIRQRCTVGNLFLEVSLVNFTKGKVNNIEERISDITQHYNLVITDEAMMLDKVKTLCPNNICMGTDTFNRISIEDIKSICLASTIHLFVRGRVTHEQLPWSVVERLKIYEMPLHLENMSSTAIRNKQCTAQKS
jgi:hypothetical protein